MSFVKGLLLTVSELFSHSRFRECGANHPRAIGHMLLFYGFGLGWIARLELRELVWPVAARCLPSRRPTQVPPKPKRNRVRQASW